MQSLSLFDYLLLAMGVYVLVAGIRGKGRLYNVENIKEGMEEQFIQTMRKLYIALGVVMTFNGLISLVKYVFYSYQEVIPATETMTAGYDWVPLRDLGPFSFLTIPVINILTYVCTGLAIVGIVVMIIVTRKMTDKEAAARRAEQYKNSADAAKQAGHILPVSAFDFEDEAAQPESDAAQAESAQRDGAQG